MKCIDIIYKQPETASVFEGYGIKNCCFKLLYPNDIKNSTNKYHHHSEYEVHIINNGYNIYETNGEEHKIECGYMLIIPPKALHRLKTYNNAALKYSITLNVDDKSQILHKNKNIFMKTPSAILHAIDIMLTEYKNNLYFSHQIPENSMYNIIVQILRSLQYKGGPAYKESTTMEDYRISIAKQYIKDNLVNNINVSDVAAHFHLSTRQFLRLWDFRLQKSAKSFTSSINIISTYFLRSMWECLRVGAERCCNNIIFRCQKMLAPKNMSEHFFYLFSASANMFSINIP